MAEKHEIPSNVNDFINKCAVRYGQISEEDFSQKLWMMCRDIASPIEQLFLTGLCLVGKENMVRVLVVWEGDINNANDDLMVIPQWPISRYRVDFAIRRKAGPVVCVELDGHQFHDKDERQRRYEKKRDRVMAAAGYKTLHFTGSEVFKDPCACALEAFNLATGLYEVATHPFHND